PHKRANQKIRPDGQEPMFIDLNRGKRRPSSRNSDRVSRLIQHHLHTTRESKHDSDAPAFVLGLATHLNFLRTKLSASHVEVVAHQGQLMTHTGLVRRALSWMHA